LENKVKTIGAESNPKKANLAVIRLLELLSEFFQLLFVPYTTIFIALLPFGILP
jgi:hypothetical protein